MMWAESIDVEFSFDISRALGAEELEAFKSLVLSGAVWFTDC